MNEVEKNSAALLGRRQTLALLGGAGVTALIGPMEAETPQPRPAFACVLAPQQTEGPYWVDEKLNRSDIRVDPSDNSVRQDVPLTLTMTVHQVTSSSCGVLPGAQVDIWHCDAAGVYSDAAANNTVGKKFLRGYQVTDGNGTVTFTTVYPGWYSGRTVHIHFRVRTFINGVVAGNFVAQMYFDDSVTDTVFTQAPYSTRRARDTRNANDSVLRQSGTTGTRLLVNVAQTGQGYAASFDVGVNLPSAPAARPVVSANGVVNAAGFQAGIAPATWVSIFGQNLATASRMVTTADLVDGAIPTRLGGVSVAINNQPAYVHYVSPTQINVQAPASTQTGSVQVVVTNSGGTSDVFSANQQAILPGLFTSQRYVAAVRADGVLVTGVTSSAGNTTAAAKPGDVLQIYGTGFGPSTQDPPISPGTVFEGSAALSNAVTVTIGGVSAPVQYAGLVAAGLDQINVLVPALASGDHEVVAEVSGLRTQTGALLKVQS